MYQWSNFLTHSVVLFLFSHLRKLQLLENGLVLLCSFGVFVVYR